MDIYIFFRGGGGGGGHYEIGLFFFWGGGSFLYILGLFKVKIQNGNIFWAAKFQIFLGQAKPIYEEKLRVPPEVALGTDLYFYSSLVLRARD